MFYISYTLILVAHFTILKQHFPFIVNAERNEYGMDVVGNEATEVE